MEPLNLKNISSPLKAVWIFWLLFFTPWAQGVQHFPSPSYFEEMYVDNLRVEGNTISTTDTNGDLVIAPDGTGKLDVQGGVEVNGRLAVNSTTEASQPAPRMTSAERNAIASPQAGDVIYNTSTNTLDVYDSVQWVAVGTGAGAGGGGINYFSNEEFDDLDDVNSYDDGASTSPVDGTGGSPAAVSTSTESAAPLSESNSLKLSKSAADGQGEGWAFEAGRAPDEIEKQGKALTLTFDYKTTANYASGDVSVWIFQDAGTDSLSPCNSIQGSDITNDLPAASGYGNYVCQFTLLSDVVDFRIVLHVATTNATAYDITLDRFYVNPVKSITTFVGSNSDQTWSPTIVGGSTAGSVTYSVQNGYYARHGDRLVGDAVITLNTVTSAPTGNIYLTLPSALQAQSRLSTTETVGHGEFFDVSASAKIPVIITVDSTNKNRLLLAGSDGTAFPTFATTDRFRLFLNVPIEGWSSGQAMTTTQADQLTARAMMYPAANQSISVNTQTDVNLDTVDFDTHNIADEANDRFKVPFSGDWKVSGYIRLASYTDSDVMTVRVSVNGVTKLLYRTGGAGVDFTMPIGPFIIRDLQIDDLVTVSVDSNAETAYDVVGGLTNSYVMLEYVNENSVIGINSVNDYEESDFSTYDVSNATLLTGEWLDIEGNSVSLTEGEHICWGYIELEDAGANPQGSFMYGRWSEEPGDDTTSAPDPIGTSSNVILQSGRITQLQELGEENHGAMAIAPIRIKLTAPKTIYLNVRLFFTTAGDGEIEGFIHCERVQ